MYAFFTKEKCHKSAITNAIANAIPVFVLHPQLLFHCNSLLCMFMPTYIFGPHTGRFFLPLMWISAIKHVILWYQSMFFLSNYVPLCCGQVFILKQEETRVTNPYKTHLFWRCHPYTYHTYRAAQICSLQFCSNVSLRVHSADPCMCHLHSQKDSNCMTIWHISSPTTANMEHILTR